MAATTAGELWGYAPPGVGETVEIPIVLTDDARVNVTGVAWDAAGMAVTYRKEGEHAFSAFPTFATDNWAECGNGEYVIILRQSDATELALMDTEGTLTFFVICTTTNGNFVKIKVNSEDVVRPADLISAAAMADAVFDEALEGHEDAGSFGAALDPDTATSLAARVAGLFHRFLTCAVITEDVDGNGELVVKDAVGGNTLFTVDLVQSGDTYTLEVQ